MNMLTYLKHPYMTTFTYIFVAIYLVYSTLFKNNMRAIGIVFLLGVCIVKFIPIKWHSYKLLWAIAIIGIAIILVINPTHESAQYPNNLSLIIYCFNY